MFCTNCGKEIDDDAVYCSYCGVIVSIEEERKEEYNILNINISKDSTKLFLALLVVGLISSIVNIIIYNNTIQVIFVLIFAISIFSLWRLNMIGITILMIFVLFEGINSILYYFRSIDHEYLTSNLIIDELFYIIIIILILINWKKFK